MRGFWLQCCFHSGRWSCYLSVVSLCLIVGWMVVWVFLFLLLHEQLWSHKVWCDVSCQQNISCCVCVTRRRILAHDFSRLHVAALSLVYTVILFSVCLFLSFVGLPHLGSSVDQCPYRYLCSRWSPPSTLPCSCTWMLVACHLGYLFSQLLLVATWCFSGNVDSLIGTKACNLIRPLMSVMFQSYNLSWLASIIN